MSYATGKELIGCKVEAIKMNSNYLIFKTDKGVVAYEVHGDCCSNSFFYDFYGVENLLNNGAIVDVKEVNLLEGDYNRTYVINPVEQAFIDAGELSLYGYQITTIEPLHGFEVTSVFSFRNESNGYYGGWMELIDVSEVAERMKKTAGLMQLITKDVIELN
jgi:hypothetical protein